MYGPKIVRYSLVCLKEGTQLYAYFANPRYYKVHLHWSLGYSRGRWRDVVLNLNTSVYIMKYSLLCDTLQVYPK